jgi:hypothetical protein
MIVGSSAATPTYLKLVDAVDNGNRAAGGAEALYLFGQSRASALADDALRIGEGSTFDIGKLNVYAFIDRNAAGATDGARAWVNLQSLFSAGVNRIAFDRGWLVKGVSTPSAPILTSIVVGNGTQRSTVRSITLSFDKPVTLANGAMPIQLLNTGGSGRNDGSNPTNASSALAIPSSADGGKTWVFAFAPGSAFVQTSGGASTGSLVDGVYRISVDPAKVTADGIAMAAGAGLTFHRLFGDVNGSKTVNAADYNAFRGVFGKNSTQVGYDLAWDFDGNGSVNALDYNQFRSRFGKGLTYP